MFFEVHYECFHPICIQDIRKKTKVASFLMSSILFAFIRFDKNPKPDRINTIPTDREQQWGRRKEEIDAEEAGDVGFNNEPIIPASDAGTKENPILVPSGMGERAVGYEDPVTHQLVWFNLGPNKLHYVPDIGLYFKLKAVGGAH